MDGITLERLLEMKGCPVESADGEQIGSVEEIYYDKASKAPEWIGVETGFLSLQHLLVPVQGAEIADECIRVPYPRDLVKDTPSIHAAEISEAMERSLYAHYGIDYSYDESPTGLAEGAVPGENAPDVLPEIARDDEPIVPPPAPPTRLEVWRWSEPEAPTSAGDASQAPPVPEMLQRDVPQPAIGEMPSDPLLAPEDEPGDRA